MVVLLKLDRAGLRGIQGRVIETEIPFAFELVSPDKKVVRTRTLVETRLNRVGAAVEVIRSSGKWFEGPRPPGSIEISAIRIDSLVCDSICRIGSQHMLECHGFIQKGRRQPAIGI